MQLLTTDTYGIYTPICVSRVEIEHIFDHNCVNIAFNGSRVAHRTLSKLRNLPRASMDALIHGIHVDKLTANTILSSAESEQVAMGSEFARKLISKRQFVNNRLV